MLLLSNQNKTKKDKEKDKSIPCVMCITNDDAVRTGNKRSDVMEIKDSWRGKRKTKKEGNDEKVVTIEENKEPEVGKKKLKN